MSGMHSSESIEFWAESRLREALENDANIDLSLAALAFGHERGDTARTVMRAVLAGFCLDALGIRVTTDATGVRLRAGSTNTAEREPLE